MPPSDMEIKSIDRRIGEIAGMISPIPDQLSNLFQKIDVEKDQRTAIDSEIKSDLRSIKEAYDRLLENVKAINRKTAEIDMVISRIKCDDCSEKINIIERRMSPILESVKEMNRILSILNGESRRLDSLDHELSILREDVDKLSKIVEGITNKERTIYDTIKWIGVKIVELLISVGTVYLLLKLGLKE
jgi:predicted  nucleic acid-binding Zn-ribbon protein